jgi:hypothetical protein
MPSPPRPTLPSEDEESFTAWPLVICLGVTKLITIVVIFLNVRNQEALMLTVATLLPWLGVSLALLSAPVAWYWRMHRARRRRNALLEAEWRSDESAATPGTPLDVAPSHAPD